MADATPDRADGVNGAPHWWIEVERRSRRRVTRSARADHAARLCQARSGSTVDGTVDTADTAAEQRSGPGRAIPTYRYGYYLNTV